MGGDNLVKKFVVNLRVKTVVGGELSVRGIRPYIVSGNEPHSGLKTRRSQRNRQCKHE